MPSKKEIASSYGYCLYQWEKEGVLPAKEWLFGEGFSLLSLNFLKKRYPEETKNFLAKKTKKTSLIKKTPKTLEEFLSLLESTTNTFRPSFTPPVAWLQELGRKKSQLHITHTNMGCVQAMVYNALKKASFEEMVSLKKGYQEEILNVLKKDERIQSPPFKTLFREIVMEMNFFDLEYFEQYHFDKKDEADVELLSRVYRRNIENRYRVSFAHFKSVIPQTEEILPQSKRLSLSLRELEGRSDEENEVAIQKHRESIMHFFRCSDNIEHLDLLNLNVSDAIWKKIFCRDFMVVNLDFFLVPNDGGKTQTLRSEWLFKELCLASYNEMSQNKNHTKKQAFFLMILYNNIMIDSLFPEDNGEITHETFNIALFNYLLSAFQDTDILFSCLSSTPSWVAKMFMKNALESFSEKMSPVKTALFLAGLVFMNSDEKTRNQGWKDKLLKIVQNLSSSEQKEVFFGVRFLKSLSTVWDESVENVFLPAIRNEKLLFKNGAPSFVKEILLTSEKLIKNQMLQWLYLEDPDGLFEYILKEKCVLENRFLFFVLAEPATDKNANFLKQYFNNITVTDVFLIDAIKKYPKEDILSPEVGVDDETLREAVVRVISLPQNSRENTDSNKDDALVFAKATRPQFERIIEVLFQEYGYKLSKCAFDNGLARETLMGITKRLSIPEVIAFLEKDMFFPGFLSSCLSYSKISLVKWKVKGKVAEEMKNLVSIFKEKVTQLKPEEVVYFLDTNDETIKEILMTFFPDKIWGSHHIRSLDKRRSKEEGVLVKAGWEYSSDEIVAIFKEMERIEKNVFLRKDDVNARLYDFLSQEIGSSMEKFLEVWEISKSTPKLYAILCQSQILEGIMGESQWRTRMEREKCVHDFLRDQLDVEIFFNGVDLLIKDTDEKNRPQLDSLKELLKNIKWALEYETVNSSFDKPKIKTDFPKEMVERFWKILWEKSPSAIINISNIGQYDIKSVEWGRIFKGEETIPEQLERLISLQGFPYPDPHGWMGENTRALVMLWVEWVLSNATDSELEYADYVLTREESEVNLEKIQVQDKDDLNRAFRFAHSEWIETVARNETISGFWKTGFEKRVLLRAITEPGVIVKRARL